ncbi:aquaporin [Loigolactobacillus coryniformis subsp. torquens DSM 20004 = KCTC 3535]|uniref:Aquaporin n=2 Tax=Loigolactobacillus coryniformis TaxID=1610 RepID=A0A2D1KLV2_9LACO|nr:aquaporin [Loigolactobacillus coryniformis subsp. torquens DSM 20004 = KCTC 3535]
MDAYLGEFVGTMILVILGAGAGASINLNKAYAKGQGWLYVAFAWGMAVAFGVYVAASFGAPGHLNPAFTIAAAISGMIKWSQVVGFIIAQMLGAFVGAAIVVIHFYPHFKASKSEAEGNTVGIFATKPAINSPVFNFLSEVIATFTFTYITFNLGNFTEGLKPFIVGFVIFAIGASLGSTTGYALNPARDWGPRFAYTVLPIPHKTAAHWEYAWVPMCGPIVGAAIAALLFNLQ